MPGRFVIDGDGVVRAVDVDPDYTVRPDLSILSRLSESSRALRPLAFLIIKERGVRP